jgi:hypothetical protein
MNIKITQDSPGGAFSIFVREDLLPSNPRRKSRPDGMAYYGGADSFSGAQQLAAEFLYGGVPTVKPGVSVRDFVVQGKPEE